MTKRQYNKVVRIIKADCRTTGTMLEKAGCANPKTCAVGALAWAACNNKPTVKQQKLLVSCGGISALFRPFAVKIEKMFGLDEHDLQAIIRTNDEVTNHQGTRERRRQVLHRVKQIAIDEYGLEV